MHAPARSLREGATPPTWNAPEQFVSVADIILSTKKRDPEANTTTLERKIDQLVYQLYGLTPKVIAIVEGAQK